VSVLTSFRLVYPNHNYDISNSRVGWAAGFYACLYGRVMGCGAVGVVEVEFEKVEARSGLGMAENCGCSPWHALPPHVFNI